MSTPTRSLKSGNNLSDVASASTARTNLGLGTMATQAAANYLTIAGGTMTGLIEFSGTGHAGLKLNSLTTAQRDALTPANGMVIYNSTTGEFQAYQSGAWAEFSIELYAANPSGATSPTAAGANGVAIGDGASASGQASTVLGGEDNTAAGAFSEASGYKTGSYFPVQAGERRRTMGPLTSLSREAHYIREFILSKQDDAALAAQPLTINGGSERIAFAIFQSGLATVDVSASIDNGAGSPLLVLGAWTFKATYSSGDVVGERSVDNIQKNALLTPSAGVDCDIVASSYNFGGIDCGGLDVVVTQPAYVAGYKACWTAYVRMTSTLMSAS